MSTRAKTSFMVPPKLAMRVDSLRQMMGISKSDFISMSIAFMLVEFSYLESSPKKRRALIQEVEAEFQTLVREALKRA